MHLANTYASDLLSWQKDAKTFVERWRMNLCRIPPNALSQRRGWIRTTSFFFFQWVGIRTLFRSQEEIPTKDKHNNSTPRRFSDLIADTSRSFILLPGMLAVLLSLLEPAPRRADRSRQQQVFGILCSVNQPVCAHRLRLQVPPALRKKHNIVRTRTPFSPWQSSQKPRHTERLFFGGLPALLFRCSSECYQQSECYDSA
jgi:hypothetical protein